MKKLALLFIICLAFSPVYSQADSIAISLATRLANRIKDSLDLSENERNKILSVNLELHKRKLNVRNEYSDPGELKYFIQQIENTRDSLYKSSIDTDEKFQAYLSRKKSLLQSN